MRANARTKLYNFPKITVIPRDPDLRNPGGRGYGDNTSEYRNVMRNFYRIPDNYIDILTKIAIIRGVLDKTEQAIINFLQYDGRMPFTQIAKKLGLTEGAVRRRVNKLVAQGKLQIVAIVEPQELGWNEAGMIAISVQPDRINAVADAVAQLPEVVYLFQAAGEFDLFAEVYCRDKHHFVSFLNEKLQKIPGVERTRSFLILKMHKLSYRWGEAENRIRILQA